MTCDYCHGDITKPHDRVSITVRCDITRGGTARGRTMAVSKVFEFHRQCYVDSIEPHFMRTLAEGLQAPAPRPGLWTVRP